MFNVGDIVKGTSRGRYTITDEYMYEGEVVRVYKEDDKDMMDVKILKHKQSYHKGKVFDVSNSEQYFQLVKGIGMHIIDGELYNV